jgi:AraC-like DNA-binding protein
MTLEILALLPDTQSRCRLNAGVRRYEARQAAAVRVVSVPHVAALSEATQGAEAAIAVVEPFRTDSSGGNAAILRGGNPSELFLPDLERWLLEPPDTPVVAYLRKDPPPRATLRLGELGVNEFVVREMDDAPRQWEAVILRLLSGAARNEFLEAFPDGLPDRVRSFVRTALDRAGGRVRVHTLVAEAVHREVTTIYRELNRAHLPPPGRIVRWARVYRAVRLVEATGMTWEKAALKLGYPSSGSLTKQVKRLTGRRPSKILDDGGTSVILELLREDLRSYS